MSDGPLEGTKPYTQQTRDTIQSNDHDRLIEHGVLLQTLINGQNRLEQQMKELVAGQVTALATWEAKSEIIHQEQFKRINAIETIQAKYIPIYPQKIDALENKVNDLENNKFQFLGGWKIMTLGFICFAWLIGISVAIVNISIHLHT